MGVIEADPSAVTPGFGELKGSKPAYVTNSQRYTKFVSSVHGALGSASITPPGQGELKRFGIALAYHPDQPRS